MNDRPDHRRDKIGPWTRLSTRDVYANPWIQVREDQILHPDGSPGIYGVVQYRNLAVGVVPIDAEGRIILVGQFRYTMNAYSWEIPEGGCHKSEESALDAAARELQEETGYTAEQWDSLGLIELSNSTTDEVGHLFLARNLTAGRPRPEPSEELAVKALDLAEAYRMAMSGELTDSLTVAGLARAVHFLNREASASRTALAQSSVEDRYLVRAAGAR
jgi:8-oxo-dGTP pyrophosphatase MutT (NUDIX family)